MDLNSQVYSQNSRSYLLPITKKYCENDSLHFFIIYFLPMIQELEKRREIEKASIKSKKIDVLIEQIWNVLPNYCESDDNLSDGIKIILPYIRKILNSSNMQIQKSILIALQKLIAFSRSPSQAHK